MSVKSVCLHNKFGYCKFGGKCFRNHENRVCQNEKCNIQGCHLRHPKICWFYRVYENCKFGMYCKFKHEKTNSCDKEIKQLKSDLQKCNEKIKAKEDKITELERMLNEKKIISNNLTVKVTELSAKIIDLENEIQMKNETIAVNSMLYDDFKERMVDKYLYDSDDELSDYEPDEDIRETNRLEFWQDKLEKKFSKVTSKGVGCEECEFRAKTISGLKVHISRKHGTK